MHVTPPALPSCGTVHTDNSAQLCALACCSHPLDPHTSSPCSTRATQALRGVPVRVGSRTYQRMPFRARAAARSPAKVKSAGGMSVTNKSGRPGERLRRASKSGSIQIDSTDDEEVRPLPKTHSLHSHAAQQGEGSYYAPMELREFREGGGGSQGSYGGSYGSKFGGSMGGRHSSGSHQLLIDEESGLVYAREGGKRSVGGAGSAGGAVAGGGGAWPQLVGYVDPESRTLVKVG